MKWEILLKNVLSTQRRIDRVQLFHGLIDLFKQEDEALKMDPAGVICLIFKVWYSR
jgi:hypothetical protein